jgi:class 3 adenylate cyclase/putative methionine-R-sulfoxide reductase with GAF domain
MPLRKDSGTGDDSLAELKNTLDRRTRELTEALERQAATADILRVISSSPSETQPVFDAIVLAGLKLFPDAAIFVALPDGDQVRAAALAESDAARAEAWRRRFPFPLTRDYMHGIAILDAKMIDIPDVANAPASIAVGAQNFLASGYRAITIIPMMRGDAAIGALSVVRQRPGPLSDQQLAVLTTFAAQAVIAVENTRLLNELRQRTDDLSEALEQQTATAEVLGVISSTPGELEPVFNAMLANATRLCGAKFGILYLREGDGFRAAALHDVPPAFAAERRNKLIFPPPDTTIGQVARTKRPVETPDMLEEQSYIDGNPHVVATARLSGMRTIFGVPLLKDDQLIGTLTIYRQVVRPFTDKQKALVSAFAAQAVIAIENTRLLNELRQRTDDLSEALEQQTATSEVLGGISSSPGELKPVFNSMLENATRICDANFGLMYLYKDDFWQPVALLRVPPKFSKWLLAEPRRWGPQTGLGRLIQTKQLVQIVDVKADDLYTQRDPSRVAFVELAGARTFVAVPMLKENELIGALAIFRQEVRPFNDKQIELVENFAAQAVIAIENTRLLNELRDRTAELEKSYAVVQKQAGKLEEQSHQLRKLNQGLEQRVSEQVGEIERVSRLRRFLPPQVADLIVSSGAEHQLESHRREITALFCDLRGFTGFSESADPEDVMALLREYHAVIGSIIHKHGGTLERFVGDGVMVIFNDPIPLPNPALQAVEMALEMRASIGALMEKWRRLGHELGFGIGISHGYATLGTIGFEGRFDYGAIGTVSNVASRLCDEAQPGQILISPRVMVAVEGMVTAEPAGEFELKGIRRPMAVHNVTGAAAAKA